MRTSVLPTHGWAWRPARALHALARRARALVAAALLHACGDSGTTTAPHGATPAPSDAPAEQIRDARSGAATGFYFLPPIAPALQSYPGTFDPDRSPVVEVCRWAAGACQGAAVARYTLTEGTGGRTLALDATNQLYRVDWPTTAVAAGVLHRIRVLDGVTLLGWADAKVPGRGETAAALTGQGIVPLGNGSRLPVRFRIEQNTAATLVIVTPPEGFVVPVGGAVTLTGRATDREQGDISSQIVWRSDRRTEPLGTGASITVRDLAGGRHTISASVTDGGGATATVTRTIVVSIVSVPAALNVPYGGTASLPITLSEPAPAGGLAFTVTSGAPSRVGVAAATVTVPAGQQSANATLQGTGAGLTTVTVTNAQWGSASSQVTTTAALNIGQSSVDFPQGRTERITIELESQGADVAAPAGGLPVTLTSADPACAVADPDTATIPEGLVSVGTTVRYGGSARTPCRTTITASVVGVPGITTDVVQVSVREAPTLAVYAFGRPMNGTVVGAGLVECGPGRGQCWVQLGAPAPAGGVAVTLASGAPNTLRLSANRDNGAPTVGQGSVTVTVPAGQSTVYLHLHGMDGQAGAVTITATAPGYAEGTGTVRVRPRALRLNAVPSTIPALSPNRDVWASVGPANADGTDVEGQQPIRPGGTPLVVTFTNGTASVARLVTSAGAAQTRTATIPIGADVTPTTLGAGGVQFDPVAGGTTTVRAAAPGVVSGPSASATVTVTASALTLRSCCTSTWPAPRVGSGLRDGAYYVFLDAPAPAGGVRVTLASSAPERLRLSASADGQSDAVGAGTATVTIPESGTAAHFWLHGMEGQTGAASVTASADGFSPATGAVTVVRAGVAWNNPPPPTTTSLSPDQPVTARVGPVNEAGTDVAGSQQVRPGGTPIDVTFTTSAPAVARLATSAGTGATRTARVVPGQSTTPYGVDAGGVAVDPVGAGTATLTVSASGLVSGPQASAGVTVTAPALTLRSCGGCNGWFSPRIGRGLRGGPAVVVLDAPAPAGGVRVTLASSDAAVLRLSASMDQGDDAVGTGAATVTVPANSQVAWFWMHGLEGASGSATITVSAPGFTSISEAATVVPVAVAWYHPPPSATTSLSTNTPVTAYVGPVDEAGTNIGGSQAVRPGGTPIVVTFANGTASVAQLVNAAGAGQARTATVPVGAFSTPYGVDAGGVAFDPLGSGTTTVTVGGAGLVSGPGASATVTVTAPGLALYRGGQSGFSGVVVGSGLRECGRDRGSCFVRLDAPAPAGGVAVTLASSAPAVLRLSADLDDTDDAAGQASVTVRVPAGQDRMYFRVHGMENQTGTVTLTASAAGFTNGSGAVAVRRRALAWWYIPGSIAADAPNADVYAYVGPSNEDGTDIQGQQPIRPGGTPMTVTFTSGTPSVARLVTSGGSGATRTATIAVGEVRTPTTLGEGGVQLDPLAAGTTNLTLSAPNTVAGPQSERVVTVTGAAARAAAARTPAVQRR